MNKIIERVNDLLRLSEQSTEIEESRNAALQACRLITKHKLVVLAAPEIKEPFQTHSSPSSQQSAPQQSTGSPKPVDNSKRAKRRPFSKRPVADVGAGLQSGSENIGTILSSAAEEAASRITIGDVFDVFKKSRRR